MATPTKRRKTNKFKSSPQTVGNLDFFFQKQKSAVSCDKTVAHVPDQEPAVGETVGQNDTIGPEHGNLTFNDEDLARKLQLEWDAEDRDEKGNSEIDIDMAVGAGSKDGESSKFRNDAIHNHRPQTPRTNLGVELDQVAVTEREDTKTDTLSLQSTTSISDTLSSTIPFDESPLVFDPSSYLSNLKAHWAKEGGHASYGLLTRCFILVNSTQSRIKIVDTLVNFLCTVIEGDPESLLPAVGIYKHPHLIRCSKV